ncbi:MAG: hypothetical protein R6V60_01735 [Desulfobacterales bacterium]
MKRFLVGLAVGFVMLAFTQVGFAQSGGVTVQWGNESKQGPAGGGYKKRGGPPPHAPAHGYRAKHQYRYYPYRNVYYDQGRGVYFYIKGDGWAVGASLPTGLRSDLGFAVNLELDTDAPYEQNGEHQKQYPKEKFKRAKP